MAAADDAVDAVAAAGDGAGAAVGGHTVSDLSAERTCRQPLGASRVHWLQSRCLQMVDE